MFRDGYRTKREASSQLGREQPLDRTLTVGTNELIPHPRAELIGITYLVCPLALALGCLGNLGFKLGEFLVGVLLDNGERLIARDAF